MEHRFTFRLDEELFAKLSKYCKENKRSLNQGLQFLLERDMDKYFEFDVQLSNTPKEN